MGGACLAPGNITPAAEANIHNDPEAAAYAFAADVSAQWDATLVPLDVTMQHTLEDEHQHRLAASDDPLARVLAEMLADGPARGATIADLRGIYRGSGESSRGGVRIVRAVDRPVIDVLLDTILG